MVPYDDKPMTLQAAQRQINAILAGCTTASSITEFTNQAKRKQDEFFLPKKTPHALAATSSPAPTYVNDNHDAFLYHRWNNSNKNTRTIRPGKNKQTLDANSDTIAHTRTETLVKDDSSVTPTLETLCTLDTLDTRLSHSTNVANDTILRITIWNQPIVQYQLPIRPNTRHRS